MNFSGALVGVAVVVCGLGRCHLFDGDDTTCELVAADMLKLDCGVSNSEMIFQHMVELDQNAGTL